MTNAIRHEIISGRECYIFGQPEATYLFIQPVDEHDLELLDKEVEEISRLSTKPYSLVAFKINDWNKELTPWSAPPVFGKEPFGDGAKETLSYVADMLLPALKEKGFETNHCYLGGYSLAGLFSLWVAYQTDKFAGIVAASPSVWFPHWMNYVMDRKAFPKSIYLSLGDKEERTKHPVMSQVGVAIRKQYELLVGQDIKATLEWNVGNHFVDSEKRMAKGFAWLMNNDNPKQ